MCFLLDLLEVRHNLKTAQVWLSNIDLYTISGVFDQTDQTNCARVWWLVRISLKVQLSIFLKVVLQLCCILFLSISETGQIHNIRELKMKLLVLDVRLQPIFLLGRYNMNKKLMHACTVDRDYKKSGSQLYSKTWMIRRIHLCYLHSTTLLFCDLWSSFTWQLELKLGLGGTSYEDFIHTLHLPMQLRYK